MRSGSGPSNGSRSCWGPGLRGAATGVIGGCEAGAATGARAGWEAEGLAAAVGRRARRRLGGGGSGIDRHSSGVARSRSGRVRPNCVSWRGREARHGSGRKLRAGRLGGRRCRRQRAQDLTARRAARPRAPPRRVPVPRRPRLALTAVVGSRAPWKPPGSDRETAPADAADAGFAPPLPEGAAVLAIRARPDHCGLFGSVMAVRAIAGPPRPWLTVS